MSTPLERYTASLRRPRIVYAVVLTVLVVVFGTIFAVVWATGSAAHATLHTVRSEPADLPVAQPAAQQTVAWRTTDQLAAGTPQWRGTLITFGTHTVRGRDVRSGAQTWSYTRSDRTVCAVGELGGYTVAVFDRDGNCDEIDTLDSATGARRWSRTLDQDGQPVDGRPSFQWNGNQTFLVQTLSVIYAIDPVSGINRWTYSRYGCTISHAVLGVAGALISQDCDARVRCGTITYCQQGHQLFLRDATAGKLDTSEQNYDQITWSRTGYTGVPASAGTVISAVEQSGRALDVLSTNTGKVTRSLTLSPARTDLDAVDTVAVSTEQLLWINDRTYAVPLTGSAVSWTVAARGVPNVVGATGGFAPVTGNARLTVGTSSGIATVDATTGEVTARFRMPTPARGSTVAPLGDGFVVASTAGTVVYR